MKIIEISNSLYPQALREISSPPQRLYVLGNEKLLNKFTIGIVGSRKYTPYGEKVAELFSKELALREVVIVSGMAVGIDTIAHENCLKYGGHTIAVLGCGFNKIYPKENEKLFEKILNSDGLVITEYLPDIEKRKEHFRNRNRIISGLAKGIIVVESKEASGTTITANWALKQKKELFVVPNNIFCESSSGCHKLLKKGGNLLTNIEDILIKFPEIQRTPKEIEIIEENQMKDEYKKIVEILKKGAKTKEEILIELKEDIGIINENLFSMEIEGIIKNKIGKGYILN